MSLVSSELFGNLLKRHFSEDSEHMIPLTNQKLFDIFAAKAEKKPVGGDALVVDNETVQHLELAKKDVSARYPHQLPFLFIYFHVSKSV